ncbi:hypothetical protein ACFWDI_26685 [Streptomyces sp. NPDC060064]|uniref:hypothetical protein n=1 Tax=Streptomyces sp. NPDC060064 TaxID=3347049 RepID=UPI0036A4CA99
MRSSRAGRSTFSPAVGRIASPVVSLTARRLAALPPDPRPPLPSVTAYDQLLRHTRPPAERPTS